MDLEALQASRVAEKETIGPSVVGGLIMAFMRCVGGKTEKCGDCVCLVCERGQLAVREAL